MRRLVAAGLTLAAGFALIGCESGSPAGDVSAATSSLASVDPLDRLPPPVRAFLAGDPEHPFGEPGPDAPQENEFFAALVGVWSCKLRFEEPTGVRFAYPSTWAFKYSAGGFVIEHLYYQREASLVPPFAALERDFHSLSLTLYDPAVQAWRFGSVNNLAGTGIGPAGQVMTGQLADDVLAFEPDVQPEELYTRDTFHHIEADHFVWTQYESRDKGASWTEGVTIVCERTV